MPPPPPHIFSRLAPSSFVAILWAFNAVDDWMMNLLSTSTACHYSQQFTGIHICKAVELAQPPEGVGLTMDYSL